MKVDHNPYIPSRGIIRAITTLAPDNNLFEISVESEAIANSMPGQFVQLWIPGVGESPISICSGHNGSHIELCVRKVGRTTNALFDMQEGEVVGLRGPYGNGFPVDLFIGQNLCLIAGGLGIAPIRSLLEYIIDRREDFGNIILVYGLRHSMLLLFRQELKLLLRRHDFDVFIAAEEIKGPAVPPVHMQLGRVTDMLRLCSVDNTYQAAICGPPVMYKYVINELKAKGVIDSNIWVSLERHMKCAVAKCGHCFVGGRFTCQAGPVFSLPDLKFLPEVVECA